MVSRRFGARERAQRLVVVLGLVGLAVLATSLSSGNAAVATTQGALLPEGLLFPGASDLIHLDGSVSVNGGKVEGLLFRTEVSPRDVIAAFRRHWEREPVDLVEDHKERESFLSVLDHHRGRRWTIVARKVEGSSTEVIRGVVGRHDDSGPAPLPFEAPVSLHVVSVVEDGKAGALLTTWTLLAEGPNQEIWGPLLVAIEAAGFREVRDFPGSEPRHASSTASVRTNGVSVEEEGEEVRQAAFERGGALLSVLVGRDPLGNRWTTIRLEEL